MLSEPLWTLAPALCWADFPWESSINFTKASWWDAGLSPVPLHKIFHFPSLSHPETFAQHPPFLKAAIQLSQIRSWTSEQTIPVCNPPASIILLRFKKLFDVFLTARLLFTLSSWLRFWCSVSLPSYHSSLSTFLSLMYSTVMSNNNFLFSFPNHFIFTLFSLLCQKLWDRSEMITNTDFPILVQSQIHYLTVASPWNFMLIHIFMILCDPKHFEELEIWLCS